MRGAVAGCCWQVVWLGSVGAAPWRAAHRFCLHTLHSTPPARLPAAPPCRPRAAALSSASSSFDWELQSLASALPHISSEDRLPGGLD